MNISIKNSRDAVVLMLAGRLDTSAAQQTATEINALLEEQGEIKKLVCHVGELEYISSSGLRILLSLAKQYPNFSVVECPPDIYQVFEMTGFSKIMTVERALRRLSVEGCEVIGIGGVGTVYRLDDDTIIKVFREGTTMDEVKREITMSKEAFVLGMPTAISFDVVRVGEQFGLVYELLDATTLSACLKQHPERVDEYARKYATLFRQLHAIEIPQDSTVPSAAHHEREQVLHIRRYFPQENIDTMLQILDAIPEGNRLLHLDLQSKNAMMQGDELMLIDMGEVGYGHPLLDLAHAYSAMVTLVGNYEQVIGVTRELGLELWNRAIGYYFEGLPADLVAHRKEQIEVVSCVRNFSWLALSDTFPAEVINECVQLFDERIGSRRDYILDVCKTFKDWTLN